MMKTKKKVVRKKVSRSRDEVSVPRPNNIPQSVWSKSTPLQRFNLSSGVLHYDPTTKRISRTNLRVFSRSRSTFKSPDLLDKKVVSKKPVRKKITKKKVTKKIRRVDWLKSLTEQSLVMTSGEGSFQFDDGSKYTGQLKDGVFHGTGIRVWEDGTIYTGDWKDGVIQGHGRIIYPSGVEYIGSWKDGIKSGRGTLFRKNGTMFSGDWEDGLVKKPLPPRVIHQFTITEPKVIKTVRKEKRKTPYGRSTSSKGLKGNESISSFGYPKSFVDQLIRKSIFTLRDLIHYSPFEVINMCGLSPTLGIGNLDKVRKELRKCGLRMRSNKGEQVVDIRMLSLSERRKLRNQRTTKQRIKLEKRGIYLSKKYS